MQESIWLELRIPAAHVSENSFTAMAKSLNCLGTAEEIQADAGHSVFTAWFATGSDVQRTRAQITAASLLQGVPAGAISLYGIGGEWETAWQRYWQAMPVGERLWVRPSFCAPPTDRRIDIVLDPGMAFGTGQHATTRLCLSAIERLCGDSSVQSMLDMGCGSGLLAIAAAKLGVKEVLAIDNDSMAIAATQKNAWINHVNIRCMPANRPPTGSFDLVVANILARPLADMAPTLAACTGKYLILSGLLTAQAEAIAMSYTKAGLQLTHMETRDEWTLLEMRRQGLTGTPQTARKALS